MDQVRPSRAELPGPFRPGFRLEAFVNFSAAVEAWLLGLGPRTLSEVWPFCPRPRVRPYGVVHDLFSRAPWDGDDLGKFLPALRLAEFAPAGAVVRPARAGPARGPARAAVVHRGGGDVHGEAGQAAPGHLGPAHFRGGGVAGAIRGHTREGEPVTFLRKSASAASIIEVGFPVR